LVNGSNRFVRSLRVIADVTLVRSNFFHFFGVQVSRKTVSEHRISINSEGLALQDITLAGGIRLNYNGFKAKSLNVFFFTINVLQKYTEHHWG